MALAPRTVQNIPDCLRREPITDLQPASITPEPVSYTHLDVYKRQVRKSRVLPVIVWQNDLRQGSIAGRDAFDRDRVGNRDLLGVLPGTDLDRVGSRRSIAVSYTHLDVYKRQVRRPWRFR